MGLSTRLYHLFLAPVAHTQCPPALSHLPANERREAIMDFMRSMAMLHKADPVKIGLYGVKGYTKMGDGYSWYPWHGATSGEQAND